VVGAAAAAEQVRVLGGDEPELGGPVVHHVRRSEAGQADRQERKKTCALPGCRRLELLGPDASVTKWDSTVWTLSLPRADRRHESCAVVWPSASLLYAHTSNLFSIST
jgi:hypothetical protein